MHFYSKRRRGSRQDARRRRNPPGRWTELSIESRHDGKSIRAWSRHLQHGIGVLVTDHKHDGSGYEAIVIISTTIWKSTTGGSSTTRTDPSTGIKYGVYSVGWYTSASTAKRIATKAANSGFRLIEKKADALPEKPSRRKRGNKFFDPTLRNAPSGFRWEASDESLVVPVLVHSKTGVVAGRIDEIEFDGTWEVVAPGHPRKRFSSPGAAQAALVRWIKSGGVRHNPS